jgi:hypothetical protein
MSYALSSALACRAAWAALLLVTCVHGIARADDDDPRPAAGIKDNSFLIEEAYNQEPGEMQHVLTLQRQYRDWFLAYSQEWALGSQAHQLGYSLPYSWLRSDGQRVKGVGDATITYRYQLMLESATLPAVAPGISLILPSGNRNLGLGDGSMGVEIKLPVSKIVSDRVTLHANAGMTHLFNVQGFSPTSYMIGGSGIYAVTRDFNVLLEGVVEWNESVNDVPMIERETTFTLNPGFRTAINFPNDKQAVFGFSTPNTFSRDKRTDYGVFFYLSFEHNINKPGWK